MNDRYKKNNKKFRRGSGIKPKGVRTTPTQQQTFISQPVTEENLLYVKYNTRLTPQQLNEEKSRGGLTSIKHTTKRTDLIPSAANVVIVEGGDIRRFEQDPNVIFVEPVPIDTEDQDDPLYYGGDNASQTNIRVTLSHEDALEEFGFGSYYPTIGQIEGQWRYEHPDISNVTQLNETISTPYHAASHALAVASVMVSDSNNGIGMMGLCPNCSLAFVNTWAIGVSLPESLEIHLEQGTKVVNYSVGSSNYSQTHQDAINDAYNNGLLIVRGAGNSNIDVNQTFYSCNYDNVLCVGANNQYNYDSSCTGQVPGPCDNIDVTAYQSMTAAPGSSVGAGSCMDLYGNDVDAWGDECWYRGNTGTSFSAPVVTGLIGLLLSHNPDLTPSQMYEIVTSTNIHPASGQRPGMIDFYEALSYMYDNYLEPSEPLPGDMNQDGDINVQDVMIIINLILTGMSPEEIAQQYPEADLSNNGGVDVIDVVIIVDNILNNPTTSSRDRQELQKQLDRLGGGTQRGGNVGRNTQRNRKFRRRRR